MGLYGFQKQFVPFIEAGEKTHTIRATRKHGDKVGNLLHLYYALRTKQVRRLFSAPCTKIESIRIEEGETTWTPDPDLDPEIADCMDDDEETSYRVFVDDVELSPDECEQLARRDGFLDFGQMMSFWEGRLPFEGNIIHWNYAERK